MGLAPDRSARLMKGARGGHRIEFVVVVGAGGADVTCRIATGAALLLERAPDKPRGRRRGREEGLTRLRVFNTCVRSSRNGRLQQDTTLLMDDHV